MKIIGITGGIGSGKSTVAKVFAVMGIPVFDSDAEAVKLYYNDEELKKSMISVFGENLYRNGILDKKFLAKKIFNDKVSLSKVNSMVHPAVERSFKKWIIDECAGCDFVAQETAILFEAGLAGQFDYIINVTAPQDIRIRRVCERNGVSVDNVKKRIKNQMNEEERSALSDFVIVNDGYMSVIKQITEIINKF